MKYLKVLLVLCLLSSSAFAIPAEETSDKDFANAFAQAAIEKAKEQAAVYKPVWEDLLTCSPSQTGDGVLKIYGVTGDKCHFTYANQDCNVSADIAKKYAESALKGIEALDEGTFNTESQENIYMESINSNPAYCKAQ